MDERLVQKGRRNHLLVFCCIRPHSSLYRGSSYTPALALAATYSCDGEKGLDTGANGSQEALHGRKLLLSV